MKLKKYMITTAILFFVASCAPVKNTLPIKSVKFNLPENNDWVQVTNSTNKNGYLREWVPRGSDVENTKWIISQQKLNINPAFTAEKFIKTSFMLAKKLCTDVLYLRLKQSNLNGYDSYEGGFNCAQQNGKEYGTFTNQRVITHDRAAYIITSELRTPKMKKAGQLVFKKEDNKDPKEFIKLLSDSVSVVSVGVKVCAENKTDC